MASRTGWAHGVTDREREVLLLVASHLTNAEIADRLSLSVRTVESHVTSLIRKLGVADRRNLARQADSAGLLHVRSGWPTTGDLFVGREAEASLLADALRQHRVVTVTGPGGVGKTTLATRVAMQEADERKQGGWFVDLSRVADHHDVVPAVAAAVGVVDAPGTSLVEALVGVLGRTDGLLLLDNCEHVLAEVEQLVRVISAQCPSVTVVATSRARLGAPYEWVYELPGLTPEDAVRLFSARGAAAGGPPPHGRAVEELCSRLDGMALAIELAAVRYPSLGLDGLMAALSDPLRLLGENGSDRQRSMRATIAWSVDLLDETDRSVFAACSVFASPFTLAAAQRVVEPDLPAASVALALGRLADQHLLQVRVGTATTYRFLEVVRQYAADLLGNRADAATHRHLTWAAESLEQLSMGARDASWCADFDRLAVELRGALARPDAPPAVGERFAEELVQRGRLEEAQARYEQLAATASPSERPRLLRLAAGSAAGRLVGDEAMRLLSEAHEAAREAGDPAAAADALAWAVIYAAMYPGIMASPPAKEATDAALAEARALAPPSSAAAATVDVADAAWLPSDSLDAGLSAALRAETAGAGLAASPAYDVVCSKHLERWEYGAAMRAIEERGRVLNTMPLDAMTAFQFNDHLLMGCEVSLAAGDLRGAAAYAERLADLPCFRDYVHPALGRRLEVDVLAGKLDDAVLHAAQFRASWEQAGRHRAPTLAVGAHAAALAHGLLGDPDAHQEWRDIARELVAGGPLPLDAVERGWAPTFEAFLLLDRDDPEGALRCLRADLEDPLWGQWRAALWRPWYAAVLAEAVVLSDAPAADGLLGRAAEAARDNPVATVLVERAEAIARGDGEAVAATGVTLEELGSSYQAERSRGLARDQRF